MKLRETSQSPKHESLAQRVATLEHKLFGALEQIATLEEENARLRDENGQLREENARLQQQLAAARKNSSTSSKPPSSDMVKPPKPPRWRITSIVDKCLGRLPLGGQYAVITRSAKRGQNDSR